MSEDSGSELYDAGQFAVDSSSKQGTRGIVVMVLSDNGSEWRLFGFGPCICERIMK